MIKFEFLDLVLFISITGFICCLFYSNVELDKILMVGYYSWFCSIDICNLGIALVTFNFYLHGIEYLFFFRVGIRSKRIFGGKQLMPDSQCFFVFISAVILCCVTRMLRN